MSNVEAHLPTIQCTGAEVAKRLFDAVKKLLKAIEDRESTAESAAILKLHEIAEWIEAASDRIGFDHPGGWQLDQNAAIFAEFEKDMQKLNDDYLYGAAEVRRLREEMRAAGIEPDNARDASGNLVSTNNFGLDNAN